MAKRYLINMWHKGHQSAVSPLLSTNDRYDWVMACRKIAKERGLSDTGCRTMEWDDRGIFSFAESTISRPAWDMAEIAMMPKKLYNGTPKGGY